METHKSPLGGAIAAKGPVHQAPLSKGNTAGASKGGRVPSHAPHERHDPHIRRQRRRRVVRHLFWRRYGWLGIILGIIGAVAAFIGSLWLTAYLLNGPSGSGASADVEDFAPQVLQVCQEAMPRVQCGCFWEKSRSAYTAENIASILQALIERDQWGPAITRGRLNKAAGDDGARAIGRALYDCVQM